MKETITFSRARLDAFQACQRRYQLRYGEQLPWPALRLDQEAETALDRGRQFHQILERRFLKLPMAAGDIRDVQLRVWWSRFEESPPPLPAGLRLPEISLTVPVGDHLLTGRFDLLIVGQIEGRVNAQVFDWKTGKVQSAADLKRDWQTRLYLAMLAVGGGALIDRNFATPVQRLEPDDVSLTYWYVDEPEAPVTFTYDSAWHQQNWAEIQALVARISQKSVDGIWPLTEDWEQCRRCGYQSYCGRHEAGLFRSPIAQGEDDFSEDVSLRLEPELP